MKRFSEFITESELLTEMARVGFMSDLQVIVYTDDPGNVPHVHILDKEIPHRFDCCVKLEYPEYFDHGSHNDHLNASGRHRLNDFMNSKCKDSRYENNYDLAVSMWNLNNSDKTVELERYEDGRIIVPDYSTLH